MLTCKAQYEGHGYTSLRDRNNGKKSSVCSRLLSSQDPLLLSPRLLRLLDIGCLHLLGESYWTKWDPDTACYTVGCPKQDNKDGAKLEWLNSRSCCKKTIWKWVQFGWQFYWVQMIDRNINSNSFWLRRSMACILSLNAISWLNPHNGIYWRYWKSNQIISYITQTSSLSIIVTIAS